MNETIDLSHNTDDLFARARNGDEATWTELFATCYPKILRVVRRKLNQPLRNIYDSTDFANDVMKSLAANCMNLDFPSMGQLFAFLTEVAERKVIDEYRRQHALKRDVTRERRLLGQASDAGGKGTQDIASDDPSASQTAQGTEVLERLLEGQDELERWVIVWKREGYSNLEIAVKTGWNIRKVQRFLKCLQDSKGNPGEN